MSPWCGCWCPVSRRISTISAVRTSASGGKTLVFVGPSLPPDLGAPGVLPEGFELRPPARRGDLLQALAEHPACLVLLDGYYYTVPSVTHKEILYALDSGVRVIGAASMGALRAVEMAPCGMEGVGWVVDQLARGEIEGDDEVAILHGDSDNGYRPLTLALVEVRAAAEELARPDDGELAAGLASLIGGLAELPFTERRRGRARTLAGEFLASADARALGRILDRPEGVKHRDARAALALAAGPAPHRRTDDEPTEVLEQTGFFGFFRDAYLRPAAAAEGSTWLDAWRLTQLLHPEVPAVVRRLRLRFLAASLAEREGLEPERHAVRRRAAALGETFACRDLGALPAAELALEARIELLAEAAEARYLSVAGACARLAERLGLATKDPQGSLLDLATARFDLVPGWSLVRAFACSSLAAPALGVARAAAQVEECYIRWAGRERPRREDLRRVAAQIWDVPETQVPARGVERGLYAAHGFDLGLDRALALAAAAERLPRPINDYPERRAELVATSWYHPRLDPEPRSERSEGEPDE